MFKVALINPPVESKARWVREGRCQQLDLWGAPFPPLSLAYISAVLAQNGHQTRIFDSAAQGESFEEFIRKLNIFNPQFIIMTTGTPTIDSDCSWFAGKLKQVLPAIKIAVCGIHVSALPREILYKYNNIDYVIIGEPEVIANNLVRAIRNNYSLKTLPGVGYGQDGQVVINKPKSFIENLDDLPRPRWEGVDWNFYKMPIINKPFVLIEFERGCPHNCVFCNSHVYHGKKIRKRSVQNIIEEINNYIKLGITDFLFWAESLTLDVHYLNNFLDALITNKLNEQISWVCNSRTDQINFDILQKMKIAGCWQIALGLEFGDENILQKSKKGVYSTLERSQIAVQSADRAGLIVDGHFIMGFPGESEETLQKTIDFACSMPLTFAHFYAAAPFPGSELYHIAVENNYINKKILENISQIRASLFIPDLPPDVVNKYIKKAYKNFYLKLSVIKRILKIPKNIEQRINLMRMGAKMFYDLIIR